MLVFIHVNSGLLGAGEEYGVLQPMYNTAHMFKEREILEFLEKIHRLTHTLDVFIRNLRLGDAVLGIGIAVILIVKDLDRGIVAYLVAAHILDIELYGTLAHDIFLALILTERLGTGGDKIVQSPQACGVPQTLINSLITDQGIFVSSHNS